MLLPTRCADVGFVELDSWYYESASPTPYNKTREIVAPASELLAQWLPIQQCQRCLLNVAERLKEVEAKDLNYAIL